jgi:hypothetical protein
MDAQIIKKEALIEQANAAGVKALPEMRHTEIAKRCENTTLVGD